MHININITVFYFMDRPTWSDVSCSVGCTDEFLDIHLKQRQFHHDLGYLAPVPQKSYSVRADDRGTSYCSDPYSPQYIVAAHSTTDTGWTVLVLHAVRKVLSYPSTLYDVSFRFILEANNRTGNFRLVTVILKVCLGQRKEGLMRNYF